MELSKTATTTTKQDKTKSFNIRKFVKIFLPHCGVIKPLSEDFLYCLLLVGLLCYRFCLLNLDDFNATLMCAYWGVSIEEYRGVSRSCVWPHAPGAPRSEELADELTCSGCGKWLWLIGLLEVLRGQRRLLSLLWEDNKVFCPQISIPGVDSLLTLQRCIPKGSLKLFHCDTGAWTFAI